MDENYDSNVPFSEAIHCTKPERVVSFDETDLPLGNGAKDVPRRTTPGTVTPLMDICRQTLQTCMYIFWHMRAEIVAALWHFSRVPFGQQDRLREHSKRYAYVRLKFLFIVVLKTKRLFMPVYRHIGLGDYIVYIHRHTLCQDATLLL